MKPHKNKKLKKVLKFLPVVICLAFIILPIASGKEITVQAVLNYTPEAPLAAAFVILFLYALKSMSFVFPIAVLQIATGHLFHTPVALLINFLGRAITLTIPYWAGRIPHRKPVTAVFLREIFGITFCACLSGQIESIYEKPKNSG